MSPSINYAEQVLREEAERLAQLKEKHDSSPAQPKNVWVDTTTEFNTSIAKVNLKDEDNFPILGKANVTTPVWHHSTAAPAITAVVNPGPIKASSGSVASSNSSSRFFLPVEHQRKDINVANSLNSTCARVMKESETTIEVSISSQTKGISFVVGGKVAGIKLAKRHLWSFLAQSGAIEFEVPEECLKYIIGPAGKVLKGIESSCAVKVKIPRGEEWTGTIVVSGDFEGVAMARDEILSIVQERANKVTVQVEIENILAPFLWKKELSGITQEELNEAFPNVKVFLIKTGETAHLKLVGDCNEIKSIEQIISKSLINLRSTIKSVNTFVPKSLHRLLIGPKGTILHQLEDETGCCISIPSLDSGCSVNEYVAIYGPEDLLLKGLSSLMEKVKGMSSEKVFISEIPFKIIQNSQKIRSDLKSFDSEISFHFNQSSCTIEIDGKRDNVLNFINNLNQTVLLKLSEYKIHEKLELDPDYLKHVIGRKGQTLQQIQKDFNVEIIIERDEIGTVCFIGIEKESVKRAIDHVNGIISSQSDLLTIQAKIDPKYHGILIGSKGSNLSHYTEKYPSVMIKFPNDDSSIVTFKGSRSEVESCHSEMISQSDAIRHESIMTSYTQSIKFVDAIKLLSRDLSFLSNFARQNDCKLIIVSEKELTLQGLKKNVDSTLPLLKEQVELIQDRDSLTFTADPQYHGFLIGSDGRNVKHLMQKYSVKVDFPRKEDDKEDDGDNQDDKEDDKSTQSTLKDAHNSHRNTNTQNTLKDASSSTIKVTGPKKNIVKARDELIDLLKYHQEHDHQEVIRIPSKASSFVIGKNGAMIDSIKIESDCNIDFIKEENGGNTEGNGTTEGRGDKEDVSITHDSNLCNNHASIRLSGTKESIKLAKQLINQIVKEFIEQSEVSVKCPNSLKSTFKREYRKLIGKYSDTLSIYARGGDTLVKIKGKTEIVKEAVLELENLIKKIEKEEIIQNDLMVSNKFHGKIMGIGGSNIKELIKEFDCDIQVPKFGESGPIILIGNCENVKKCSDKIRSICIEESFFKFPSISMKTEIISKLDILIKSMPVPVSVEWKQLNGNGIILIGETDQIEMVRNLLQEEIKKHRQEGKEGKEI